MTYYIYAKAQCNNCIQYFYVQNEGEKESLPAPNNLRSNLENLTHDKKSELIWRMGTQNVVIKTLVYNYKFNEWQVGEEAYQVGDSLRTMPNETILDNLGSVFDLGSIDFHSSCNGNCRL